MGENFDQKFYKPNRKKLNLKKLSERVEQEKVPIAAVRPLFGKEKLIYLIPEASKEWADLFDSLPFKLQEGVISEITKMPKTGASKEEILERLYLLIKNSDYLNKTDSTVLNTDLHSSPSLPSEASKLAVELDQKISGIDSHIENMEKKKSSVKE